MLWLQAFLFLLVVLIYKRHVTWPCRPWKCQREVGKRTYVKRRSEIKRKLLFMVRQQQQRYRNVEDAECPPDLLPNARGMGWGGGRRKRRRRKLPRLTPLHSGCHHTARLCSAQLRRGGESILREIRSRHVHHSSRTRIFLKLRWSANCVRFLLFSKGSRRRGDRRAASVEERTKAITTSGQVIARYLGKDVLESYSGYLNYTYGLWGCFDPGLVSNTSCLSMLFHASVL